MTASTADALRHAPLTRVLRALALGETSSEALTAACLDAIDGENVRLRAWTHVDADGALSAARASDARRAQCRPLGRLDGVPLAVQDNLDVAGLPTGLGLPGPAPVAAEDAHAVTRLRGAGAVILGKTALDEAAFGTLGRNPHHGDVRNPRFPGKACGGASAGAAAAVAAGHASAAIGSDTLGAIRIPAAFCGLAGLRPTFGEIGCRGLAPALRRLDSVGVLARAVADIAPLLQVMAGYDPGDPRSRMRRTPFALPDWQPGTLRVGVVRGLEALGVQDGVIDAFERAVARAAAGLGSLHAIDLDLAPLEIAATRRAALLLMEAEILAAHGDRLAGCSPRLRGLLAFAEGKRAVDYAVADRRLDAHVVRMRLLFERVDVLLLPTVSAPPPDFGAEEPSNLADLSALASLAGCPALSLPLGDGIGLQLVGARGSDLRLLELGQILACVIDAGGWERGR